MSRPVSERLRETQDAFDSVAADYDGQRGNNELIQDMREEMWRWLDALFPTPRRLLDIGCGTGLDTIRMAQRGHYVTAIDWSPQMARRTADRARLEGVTERVRVLPLGAHELERLGGEGVQDGAYSNLGPLNCVPSLRKVSHECARLLGPGGTLAFTVIGRICPWEIAHYLGRRQYARVKVRFARGPVPVSMNEHTIWTQYYGPREFYRAFEHHFSLTHYRGLCVFAPPPYLTSIRKKHPGSYHRLWQLDRHASGWPLLREMGDHFLIVMTRR